MALIKASLSSYMSGHNKWAQIKHKKAITDAKRGKMFGKMGRAISIAARENPDPSTNLRLKGEIDRARAQNMPNDNIERAIRRVNDKDSAALTEILLELIGPGNAGIIVTAITDNSNRTISEIRQLATRLGGRMAGQGSVVWMFAKTGIIRIISPNDPENIQLSAIENGADDVRVEDGNIIITTRPEMFEKIKRALLSLAPNLEGIIEFAPNTLIPITESSQQKKLEELLDALDEQDDVQDIFTNAEY